MALPIETLDEVLAQLTPLFAARGYRKAARNFVAQEGGVARVVQVQTSQLKKPAEASFTVNALVTSVAFHEAYAGEPFPRNAASAEPVVQAPVGKLLPDGEPVWWSLREEVSAELTARDVWQTVEQHVLPFLARFADEDALLAELERGAGLPGFSAMRERCRAVLLAKRGRAQEAARVLADLLQANSAEGLEGFRESVRQLAGRLGVVAG